jgi:type III pantothenate kinase
VAEPVRGAALLIDIGNTRIKWALLEGGRLGRQHAAIHCDWGAEDYARRVIGAGGVERILVASVAGVQVNKTLAIGARSAGLAAPRFVKSQREAAGVRIGYADPWRLGVDRFLSVIAAHHLFEGRAVCVVGVGTAMTIDLLGADGRHWGGAIIPAPNLMVDTLLKNTNGIRRRAQGGTPDARALFGRSTRAAIVEGARYAAAATIDRAVAEGRKLVGRAPVLVLTGGEAPSVKPLIRSRSQSVPDLVLRGLAVLAQERTGVD